jgi:hypothetical protein
MHNAECPCCGHDSETTRINHTTSIFDCLKLDDVRSGFFQRLETILPETRDMSNAGPGCLALLMGDDPPPGQPEENETCFAVF